MKKLPLRLCKLTIFSFLTFSLGAHSNAQTLQIDYYGIVSTAADTNMLKMAQDVFLNQLKSIDGVSVDDKRQDLSHAMTSIPTFTSSGEKIAFYAEITGENNGDGQTKWNCRFNAISPHDGLTHSKNESYESYYKILTGSKSAIEAVLNNIRGTEEKKHGSGNGAQDSQTTAKSVSDTDIESLAGTWTGEPYTDKIIILRGGRGFVIFKNGATMNIKIMRKNDGGSGTKLEITQVGKSNASFFPELPRETALSIAAEAKPIIWNFNLTSQGTLEGTKTTLMPSENGASQEKIPSMWTKQ